MDVQNDNPVYVEIKVRRPARLRCEIPYTPSIHVHGLLDEGLTIHPSPLLSKKEWIDACPLIISVLLDGRTDVDKRTS
jgi:hypothetical protein